MHLRRELISLRIHREVARRLLENPEQVIAKARDNLYRWRSQNGTVSLGKCYSEWLQLLETLTPEDLACLITSEGEEPERLRQNSPFPGILSPQELWHIKKEAAHATV